MSDKPEKKCVEGLPPWVATFADLMSLLMCFFVLLLSFATMDANRFKKMAESLRDAFGVQREVIAYEVVKGTSVVAEHFSPATTDPTVLEEVRQDTTQDEKEHLEVPDQEKQSPDTQDKHQVTEQKKVQVMTEVMEKEQKEVKEAEELADDVREFMLDEIKKELVSVDNQQGRVVIRIHEKGSFPSGSADFNPAFLPIMNKITAVVNGTVGTVIVAGHTDNIPIKTSYYRSNWELSAARAVTVAHAILRDGTVDAERMIVEGHADTLPLETNDTPEGRAANRRVEIILIQGQMPQQETKSVLEVVTEQ